MQNDPSTAGNPRLPADAEAAKKTQADADASKQGLAEEELDKSETDKEKESHPDDKKPFNLDKVDDLENAKKGEKED